MWSYRRSNKMENSMPVKENFGQSHDKMLTVTIITGNHQISSGAAIKTFKSLN